MRNEREQQRGAATGQAKAVTVADKGSNEIKSNGQQPSRANRRREHGRERDLQEEEEEEEKERKGEEHRKKKKKGGRGRRKRKKNGRRSQPTHAREVSGIIHGCWNFWGKLCF